VSDSSLKTDNKTDRDMKMGIFLATITAIFFAIIPGFDGALISTGFFLISFGGLLNFLAIRFNGGRMPALAKNLHWKKTIESSPKHILLNRNTRLKCLCDIIPMNRDGDECMGSIGDLLIKHSVWSIYSGLFLLGFELF